MDGVRPECGAQLRWCTVPQSRPESYPALLAPNNLLSDTDVAISNIAGYCAKIRVSNCPCPPVPLPPSRRTGVYQEESLQLSPYRPGAYHSIGSPMARI